MLSRPWNGSLSLAVFLAVAVCSSAALAQEDAPGRPEKKLSESKLLKLLIGGDKGRMEAFAGLEPRGDDKLTAKLFIKVLDKEVKRANDQPRETSVAMIIQLGKIDRPEARKALLEYLVVANYRYGMIAAESLGQDPRPELIDDIKKAGKDKNFAKNFNMIFGFRKSVVTALLQIEDPRIVEFCIQLLPNVDGVVRYDILRFLTVMTDQDFGNNPENWTIWWEDNKDDFQFTQRLAEANLGASRNLEIKGLNVPTYYGIKMYAKRIVFVIDISSSMHQDGPQHPNKTRLVAAKEELAATLMKLPEDVNFSLLAFNAGIKLHRKGAMIPATQENRETAAKWVMYLNWNKGTNSHGALMNAFNRDTNTESIMFLSDGKPSRGKPKIPAEILAKIRNENRFRKVGIFSIGVFTGGAQNPILVEFMTKLAEQNHGVYRQIN